MQIPMSKSIQLFHGWIGFEFDIIAWFTRIGELSAIRILKSFLMIFQIKIA